MTSAVHPVARTPEEWSAALAAAGARPFAAKQVFDWIHRRGVLDTAAMTNLPAPLRASLSAEGLAAVGEVERVHASSDGTRKLLVRFADGATAETVLIPSVSGPGSSAAVQAESGAVLDRTEDSWRSLDRTEVSW
ncbi:MAG: 23S rRNA (adenine(2503)-C(2))-methyltransferase RlmN, partial [Polyangiaceae bacterium]